MLVHDELFKQERIEAETKIKKEYGDRLMAINPWFMDPYQDQLLLIVPFVYRNNDDEIKQAERMEISLEHWTTEDKLEIVQRRTMKIRTKA